MREILGVRRKYRIRKALSSSVATGVIFLLLAVFANAAFGMYQKGREAFEKRNAAKGELARLLARETELRLEIARLSTNRGVEEELRERYLIAKEGEQVAIINERNTTTDGASVPPPSKGFWKKLLSAIGFSGE